MKWPEGWSPVDDRLERANIEAELYRAASKTHVLQNEIVKLIGRREGQDDFLFQLRDGRVAVVHLTWAKEVDPAWPATELHHSFDAWRLARGVTTLREATVSPPDTTPRQRLLRMAADALRLLVGIAGLAYLAWIFLRP